MAFIASIILFVSNVLISYVGSLIKASDLCYSDQTIILLRRISYFAFQLCLSFLLLRLVDHLRYFRTLGLLLFSQHLIIHLFSNVGLSGYSYQLLILCLQWILFIFPITYVGHLSFGKKYLPRFILLGFMLYSLSFSGGFYEFFRIIERVTSIDFNELLRMEIPNKDGSYRVIPLFWFYIENQKIILHICAFWWMYQFSKTKTPLFTALRSCRAYFDMDRISTFILFSVLSSAILFSSIEIMSFIKSIATPMYSVSKNQESRIILQILARPIFLLGISTMILIASIYRSFLLTLMASKGRYPDGYFILLQIPLLRWIFLSLLVFRDRYFEGSAILRKGHIALLKDRFAKSYNNNGWKVLFILIASISLWGQYQPLFLRYPSGMDYFTHSLVLIVGIGTILLGMFYLYHSKLFWIIIGTSTILNFIPVLLGESEILSISAVVAIAYTVLFFAFFHFDQIDWVFKHQEKQLNESIVEEE